MSDSKPPAVRLPSRPLIGCIHHASHLKQSPPTEGAAFSEFMRAELLAARDAGFNSYVLECGWADLEWQRDAFDFDRTDRQLALCEELGLLVHLWLFAELTPRWFRAGHPEALCIAASGRPGMSHSIAHPFARERMAHYVRACVERYGPHAVSANVGIESGLHWVKGPDSLDYDDSLYDYNPAAIVRWRAWLEERHGSLERFGRLARERFPSWEDVRPPTRRPFRTNPMLENQVPWLEWRRFTIELFAEYVGAKAAAVRAAAPGLPVSDQSYEVDPSRGAQDVERIDAAMDVAGTSFFVSNAPGDFPLGNYLLDYHRSGAKEKPFWIWELRSGQNAWGITNWGPPVDDADLARFTWQALGAGAKAIQYWNWRPHLGGLEVGGHGMTERDGAGNARTRRMGALVRTLDEGRAWFMGMLPPRPRVALLDARDARIVAAGESSDRLIVAAQQGVHAALAGRGLGVDFVSEAEIRRGGLAGYRMLVLACAYVMAEETARAVEAWVEGGGVLVGGMFCAAKDEFGFAPGAVPGHGLDEVFGAREGTVTPIYSPDDRPVSQFGEAWDVPINGRRALSWVEPSEAPAPEAFRYVVRLVPTSAAVLAVDEDGSPALTRRAHGRGVAYLLGTLPIPADPFETGGLGAWLAAVAAEAGVVADVELVGPRRPAVFARVLDSASSGSLLVLLSASSRPERVRVRVSRAASAATHVESGAPAAIVQLPGGRVELEAEVPPRDALAVRLLP